MIICFSVAFAGESSARPVTEIKPYSSETILVKLKEERPNGFMSGTGDKFGSEMIRSFSVVPNLHLLRLPPNTTIEKALEWYNSQPEVAYAEPNYFAGTMEDGDEPIPVGAPNIKTIDPLFTQQWALNNFGQSAGTIDADINGVESWLIEVGSQTPVIGIIDSGVDYNHADLNANLWHNSGEIPANGIDDDANGYVDDDYGINAITGSGNPLDDFHHGTRVNGVIGGVANNSIGISGVMKIASMANCKFLSNTGTGNSGDAIECIQYFANLKTRFYSPENIVAINASWVIGKSQAMQDAITSLRDLGIIFVAAAGNAGTNNDVVASFPANYPVTNIIAVAATDRNDLKPSFSNFGKTTVHVAAPGASIISTIPNGNYGTSSGSSLAAPHVTGLIGLLASEFPSMTWSQIKNLAIAGGEELTNLQSITMSGRRIRGADLLGVGSLTCLNQVVKARSLPLSSEVYIAKDSPLLLKALHIVCDSPNGEVTVYDDGITTVVLADGGIDGDDFADDGVYSLNWIPTIAGDYALDFGNGDIINVRVYDPSNWNNYNITTDTVFTAETFTGTSLGGGDETLATLTSPFPILYGGDATGFTTLFISSNGAISLTDPVVVAGVNTNLPRASSSTLIAPFWDDLTFTLAGAAIYYQTIGSVPNRKLVIEWRNVKHFNVSGTGTFQVIFYEGRPEFRFAYKDTDFGSATYNSGKSATVGAQLSPSLFKLHSYLQPQAQSNKSILFTLQQ